MGRGLENHERTVGAGSLGRSRKSVLNLTGRHVLSAGYARKEGVFRRFLRVYDPLAKLVKGGIRNLSFRRVQEIAYTSFRTFPEGYDRMVIRHKIFYPAVVKYHRM